MLNKESFFALKPEVREVQVPALGGSVFVRQLTCGERDRFEMEQARDGEDVRSRMIVASVCDESGVRLFTRDDVPRLSTLPCSALDAIVNAAIELNKLTPEDVEDLEKN